MFELRAGLEALPHFVKGSKGRPCEVWSAGEMIATIYPTETGIRIISKHRHHIGNRGASLVIPTDLEITFRTPDAA